MKRFESFLARELEEYVAYRKHLGYAKDGLGTTLTAFDRYLKKQNADWDAMQPSFFLQLRTTIKKDSKTVNRLLSAIRSLFGFFVRQGIYESNPLQDIPSLTEKHFIPFVFSPEETDQLLRAICKRLRKTQKHFLTDVSTYLAILLMARCGMRISEPLRLLRTHYRPDDGTLYIEKTKFRKDRLIPVPKAVIREIENYLSMRQSLMPHDDNPYLLAGHHQNGLKAHQVRDVFHQAVSDIGLKRSKQAIGNVTFGYPIPHSLRHAFAINTLKRIKERGESTQYALPVLAAYMGHRKYHYTHAYLKVSDAKHVAGLISFSKSRMDQL
jgi:integrase/recombinase XerD